MKLFDFVEKYSRDNLYNSENIKNKIEELGWSVEESNELGEEVYAKADISKQVIEYTRSIKNEKDEIFILLHELYHILEGKIANYSPKNNLETADIFAALVLNNYGKIDLIPTAKMKQINDFIND
ncbi:MAG: hypothetical protein HRT99_02280 [Mycoplasmatales bacterium]|nr:hypothetical protein [Mycoplasmatales bacterium]